MTKLGRADGSVTGEEIVKQYYYHSDHLGSAQLITDADGQEYERIEYTPYGELWIEKASIASNIDIPYRFTGKEKDEETGLYYYGARYLDAKTSRWLSTDPAIGDYIPGAPINDEARKRNGNLPGMGGVFNTINSHLYHYAGNNPVKYTDPDGRIVFLVGVGTSAGAGAGGTTSSGIAIGFSKEKGLSIGFFSSAGGGSEIGVSVGIFGTVTIAPTAETVTDASGVSMSIGGSGRIVAAVGVDLNLNLDGSGESLTINVGFSPPILPAEVHTMITTTEVTGGTIEDIAKSFYTAAADYVANEVIAPLLEMVPVP
ncbi:hypothetical protein FACS189485_15690 [Spirochaetia bacterium]|nr:hypothetical protein FACS189485_15690 [Spirochaetia bacterium]